MTKQLCFCADDFALNHPISRGILSLLSKQRLQATSCMTQSPLWMPFGRQLIPFKTVADIGLHLNFTHDFGNNFYQPLHQLIFNAWANRLSRQVIQQAIAEQWQQFIETMQSEPDFVDGHQHIHQFPIIREELLTFLEKQGFQGWIRNLSLTLPTPHSKFKSWVLSKLGANALKSQCQIHSFAQNNYFAGIYGFNADKSYQDYMTFWLNHAPTHTSTLIMCHPGEKNLHNADSIAAARLQELNYLSSEEFLADCEQFEVIFRRISDLDV